jgi:TolA-binding protein
VPRVIYPRFTNADFVAPPSELEPNDAARNEYLQALTLARLGRAAEAAAALRAFAQHYPTSRLASRALFLAALVDTQPDAVAQDVALLRQFFPRSEYLTELQLRGVIGPGGISAAAPTPTPTPASNARLDALRALAKLREEAEQDYRDRNYAAAVAKLENSPLTQQSPELLDLMAQSLVALGDNVRAATIIEKVLAEFPNYEGRKNLLLTYGLVLEDAGKYERAIAEYRKLIEEAPDSVEAQTARVRIHQLDQLSR